MGVKKMKKFIAIVLIFLASLNLAKPVKNQDETVPTQAEDQKIAFELEQRIKQQLELISQLKAYVYFANDQLEAGNFHGQDYEALRNMYNEGMVHVFDQLIFVCKLLQNSKEELNRIYPNSSTEFKSCFRALIKKIRDTAPSVLETKNTFNLQNAIDELTRKRNYFNQFLEV